MIEGMKQYLKSPDWRRQHGWRNRGGPTLAPFCDPRPASQECWSGLRRKAAESFEDPAQRMGAAGEALDVPAPAEWRAERHEPGLSGGERVQHVAMVDGLERD